MENINHLVKSFIIGFGAFCGYFMGGWDVLLEILVLFVVIDYVSGMIAAFVTKQLKSKVGFVGIAKKVMLFLVVAVASKLDVVFGSNSALREAAIFFYLANEVLSIFENAGRIGIPLPPVLTNAVEVLKGKDEKKEEGVDVK